MDTTSEEARQKADDFYDTKVFPLVKKVFLSEESNQPSKSYYGLILPVGTSPEPLILSILALKPEKIHFLYTPETEEYLDRITGEANLSISQTSKNKIDGSDVAEIYRRVREVYESWEGKFDIAVDISGGKKSMVSGASMAAAVISADVFYIDNRKYLPKFRKPEPGSEFLNCLENPYIVFGDLELKSAEKLIESHDYLSAKQIFDRLEKQVSYVGYSQSYRAYKLLCEAYEAWDNLDFGRACESLGDLVGIIERYTDLPPIVNQLSAHLDIIKEQKEIAKYLSDVLAKQSKLETLQGEEIFNLAFMLYCNAQRRKSQQKLDMAALLMYRLLEWIGQYRFAQYGIDTGNPDYSKLGVSEENITSKINNQYRSQLKGFNELENLPAKIGLLEGYMILGALDDEICQDINWSKLSGLLRMRNESIFAHGFNNITEKNYSNFEKLVIDRFDKLCQIERIDRTEMERIHTFVNPFS